MKKMNIRAKTGISSNVYYKDLIFWIKSYSCKLFFSNHFHLSGDEKNFGGELRAPPELPVSEVDLDIVQDEKRYPKSNIHANISQQKSLFKKARLSVLILYQKRSDYHAKGLKPTTVNLLGTTSVLWMKELSFLEKLGCIVLISLPELISALIKCWSNCIGYLMYGTCWSSETIESVFILATVTNAKVAKTDTSFLAFCQDIC